MTRPYKRSEIVRDLPADTQGAFCPYHFVFSDDIDEWMYSRTKLYNKKRESKKAKKE